MSYHFTYEIDERNLRMQLKDMEVPMKEDAWQKFEAFSAAQPAAYKAGDRFRNFQVPLNRNVILPVVFGMMIILFSLLLFNFVSIKNPQKASAEPVPASIVTPPEVKQTSAIPVNPAPQLQTEVQNTEAVKVADVKITAEKETPLKEVAEETVAPVQVVAVQPAVIKKRARRNSAEEAALQSIRPNPVTDDQEPDVRPD